MSYFLTRFHKVHNSYGRAAIRLDKREMVCFSWIEMHHQETDLHKVWEETGVWDDNDLNLKEKLTTILCKSLLYWIEGLGKEPNFMI